MMVRLFDNVLDLRCRISNYCCAMVLYYDLMSMCHVVQSRLTAYVCVFLFYASISSHLLGVYSLSVHLVSFLFLCCVK